MRELFRRLAIRPVLATELLVATFFINVLAFASPLFVIQILNRYITFGFDGTLITLTIGVLIAVLLYFLFRQARIGLAEAVSVEPDYKLTSRVLEVISRAKGQHLLRLPPPKRQEVVQSLQTMQSAYDAQHIINVLDLPFFLLFVFATWLLSPVLAWVVLIASGLTFVIGFGGIAASKGKIRQMKELTNVHRGLVLSAVDGAETVRAFHGRRYLDKLWQDQVSSLMELKSRLTGQRGLSQNALRVMAMLIRVVIFAVGAKLVVMGELTIGALFGASILGSYAYQSIVGYLQTSQVLAQAKDARKTLDGFLKLPLESDTGTALTEYTGRLELKDLAFIYPGGSGPLFESFSLQVPPGGSLLVYGPNGSGKTTLARLLVGLLDPSRGQVLVDGIDLRQIAPEWWRSQIVYLPQDPLFLNGTIRDNITMNNPDLDNERLNAVVRMADLRAYLDQTPEGLDTPLTEGGRTLPMGIRRRLALARALATDGRLAIFDEPTEALDAAGRKAVFQVMSQMAKEGRTLVIFSHEPGVIQGARIHVDLGVKPVPAIKSAPPLKIQNVHEAVQ